MAALNRGERLSGEIWRRFDWLEAEEAREYETGEPSKEKTRKLKNGIEDMLL